MPRWYNVKSDQLFCLSRKNWFSKSTGCSAKLPLLSAKSLYNLWHLKNFWANSSEILLWENLGGKNFEEHYVQLFLTFLQNTMYRVALTLASFALTMLQRHYTGCLFLNLSPPKVFKFKLLYNLWQFTWDLVLRKLSEGGLQFKKTPCNIYYLDNNGGY